MGADNFDKFFNELREIEQSLDKNYARYYANWTASRQEIFTFPLSSRSFQNLPPTAVAAPVTSPLTYSAVGLFLASCPQRAARKALYQEYTQPQRNLFDQENFIFGREILDLRRRKARLLCFDNYLAFVFADKMESSYAHIYNFLLEALTHVRPAYENNLALLRRFARRKLRLTTLQPWDVLFVMNCYFDEVFGHDENLFAEYYPLATVLPAGLEILEELFDLKFTGTAGPAGASYSVQDAGTAAVLGRINFNFTTPAVELSGGAHTRLMADPAVGPIINIACPIYPPGADRGLSHGQLITLFHELGHALERIFAARNTGGIPQGRRETDVLEFFSKFLENFILNEHILRKLSARRFGEKIPSWRLQAARRAYAFERIFMNYQSLVLSLFDLTLNLEIPSHIGHAGQQLFQRHGYVNYTAHNFARMPELFAPEAQSCLPGNFYSYLFSDLIARQIYNEIAKDRSSAPALLTDYSVRDKFYAQSHRRSFYDSYRDFTGRQTIRLDLDALIKTPASALIN